MTPKVPVPTPRETKSHFKQRCWAAQMGAQTTLPPDQYREFCNTLKAQWAIVKSERGWK
jgi:hypothetical protein